MSPIIVFILPHHFIGGAEKVHLEIIKSLNRRPFVFFDSTDGSPLHAEFKKYSRCFFLSSENRKKKFKYFLCKFSNLIQITVFGCNSFFFYDLLPFLNAKTVKIDLTHAFSYPDTGIEIVSCTYTNFINYRIVINEKTYNDYKILYEQKAIPEKLLNRIQVIPNGVDIFPFNENLIKLRHENFTIGFVGRCAVEKRPDIFFEVSRLCITNGVKSIAIGDNFSKYKEKYNQVKYIEGLNDSIKVRDAFSKISLLVLTSYREGFPLVIMEAMELGIPVICTNVGSISEHVLPEINGFLMLGKSDNHLILECIQKIEDLKSNYTKYFALSRNARKYAVENFDIRKFRLSYKKLFNEK